MKQYQFISKAAVQDFLQENDPSSALTKAAQLLVNKITSSRSLPWDTPFYLKTMFHEPAFPNGYYLCNSEGAIIVDEEFAYFSREEFDHYLQEYKPSEGFKLEDLNKTIYISETKGWDVRIEGHFDEDGIKSVIAKLEGLLK